MEHHKPAPKIAIARELAAFLWAALHPTPVPAVNDTTRPRRRAA
jgi:hypothetical protein